MEAEYILLVMFMFNDHPVFLIAVIIGIAILFIRSVIRALQRWEVIPDPLLPERWRRAVNSLQRKALEESAGEGPLTTRKSDDSAP
ncbi:MAG: hypothetical protein DMF59_04840 [Acidobacteria bacterium]|nr:MAG: hypothetical protein DMF59_04840 [Acidobacteriota bacterium]